MRNSITLLLFMTSISYVALGADAVDDVHIANVERAIAESRNVISNDIATAYYDFSAILEELKCVRSEQERLRLIEQLVSPLFEAQDNQWKSKSKTNVTLEKDHLLRLALSSLSDDKYILFKWTCHLKRLQSIKKELSLYDDARNPDDVRRDLWPKIEEDFKQDVERRRAQSNEKVFVISGPVKLPKEYYDARARWGYKEWLESSIRFYEKENFDAIRFKNDFMRLSADERLLLMTKVHKELGRYPDWYLEEKKKGAK